MITTRTVVNCIHRGVYGREPTFTEFGTWRSAINQAFANGTVLDYLQANLTPLFIASAYVARSRSDEQFVRDLYMGYFQRIPDATELAFWVTNLGSSSRSAVNTAQSESVELADKAAIVGPVDQYPTPDIGGPLPNKVLVQPADFDSVTLTHEFEDGGIRTVDLADSPILRWQLNYDGKDRLEASQLDTHFDDACSGRWPFLFQDRDTGILYDNCHYDNSSGGGSSGAPAGFTPDHGNINVQSRVVLIMRRPN